ARPDAGARGGLWRSRRELATRCRRANRHRQVPHHARARYRRERPRLGISRRCGRAVSMSLDLLSLTPEAAKVVLEDWLGQRAEATALAAALRAALDEAFPLHRMALKTHQISGDGTEKFLWALEDGEAIESVLIPEGKRRTLCISSQAGCALGCVFCATGRMGFRRNLSAGEIAGQVRELMLRDPTLKPTNVVFMGMWQPLLK